MVLPVVTEFETERNALDMYEHLNGIDGIRNVRIIYVLP